MEAGPAALRPAPCLLTPVEALEGLFDVHLETLALISVVQI